MQCTSNTHFLNNLMFLSRKAKARVLCRIAMSKKKHKKFYKSWKRFLNELTPLNTLVRGEYFAYLIKSLSENAHVCSKTGYQISKLQIERCAELLEEEALANCMVAPIYQSIMCGVIKRVKKYTNRHKLERTLKKVVKKQNVQTSNQIVQKLDVAVQTNEELNDFNNTDASREEHLKQTTAEMVHLSKSCLENLISTSHNNNEETIIAQNNDLSSAEVALKEDDIDIKLAQLFAEELADTDDVLNNDNAITDIEKCIVSPTNLQTNYKTINTTQNAVTKQLQRIPLSASVWPCELFMQRRQLSASISQLLNEDMRWHDALKFRFTALFGEDSDDEFAACSPTIELNNELLSSCQTRIKPWIIKHLMVPFQEGLIANRYLFKELAKRLSRSIVVDNQYPDENMIIRAVQRFFCECPKVITIADLADISNTCYF